MELPLQLDLFEDNSPINLLQKELSITRTQLDKLRKGIFARHTELANIIIDQQKELDYIKSLISSTDLAKPKACVEPLFPKDRKNV